MQLTLDEQLELARIMNPGRRVMVDVLGGVKTYLSGTEFQGQCLDVIEFNPSLAGEDWQVSQAVALLNKLAQGITSLSDTRAHIIIFAMRDRAIGPACAALLAGGAHEA